MLLGQRVLSLSFSMQLPAESQVRLLSLRRRGTKGAATVAAVVMPLPTDLKKPRLEVC